MLRIVLTADVAVLALPDAADRSRPRRTARSWTGPFQPGVTAPDPTESDEARDAARAARAREREARRRRQDRPAPAASARPSRSPASATCRSPTSTLPDGIRELLGGSTRRRAARRPARPAPSPGAPVEHRARSSTSSSPHEPPPRRIRSSRARCWSGRSRCSSSCVSVMLAVQANSGLPFVPTYNLQAPSCPAASNLIVGNEVRWGGYQVGIIEDIKPGRPRARRHALDRGRPHEARQGDRAAGGRHRRSRSGRARRSA